MYVYIIGNLIYVIKRQFNYFFKLKQTIWVN